MSVNLSLWRFSWNVARVRLRALALFFSIFCCWEPCSYHLHTLPLVFYSFRRLDYGVISKALVPKLCDNQMRLQTFGSDHCPMVVSLAMWWPRRPSMTLLWPFSDLPLLYEPSVFLPQLCSEPRVTFQCSLNKDSILFGKPGVFMFAWFIISSIKSIPLFLLFQQVLFFSKTVCSLSCNFVQ